jgi:hypothetical protein
VKKQLNKPRIPTKEQRMTKEQFMIQYVLNRALARPDALTAEAAAESAELAWRFIQGKK